MPKRIGFLYDKMCDKELIRKAILVGSQGKRKRKEVQTVLKNIDLCTDKIYDMLTNNAFQPTPAKHKIIYDKSSRKEREISIVPFYPDGIVHQLVVMVTKDVFMRGMYPYSCASIPGRGIKYASDYVKRALKRRKKTKYCLKMDIHKYYPSIPIDKLMAALRRKIKDERLLALIESIISDGSGRGLAIGYYTNQWLANFYLEVLDWYITTLDGVEYYVRYMDDMVLLGANKKKLRKARVLISEFLVRELGLELKSNWQVFPVKSRGIDFVGYRFYHTHINLRRKNFLRLARQSRRVRKKLETGAKIFKHQAAGMLSRMGQLYHCSNYFIRQKYLNGIKAKYLKQIIRQNVIKTRKVVI